jgi:hypothetical protein
LEVRILASSTTSRPSLPLRQPVFFSLAKFIFAKNRNFKF